MWVVSQSRSELEQLMLQYSRSTSGHCILIKEYGKQGNHPHLNLIYTDKVKHIRNVYRKIEKHLDKANPNLRKDNSRLIHIQPVDSIHRLVTGYLKKETNSETLYKRGFNTTSHHKLTELQEEINNIIKNLTNEKGYTK